MANSDCELKTKIINQWEAVCSTCAQPYVFSGIDISNLDLIYEIVDTALMEYQRETYQRESSEKLQIIGMDHLLSNTFIPLGL